jgi:hypothetical protein
VNSITVGLPGDGEVAGLEESGTSPGALEGCVGRVACVEGAGPLAEQPVKSPASTTAIATGIAMRLVLISFTLTGPRPSQVSTTRAGGTRSRRPGASAGVTIWRSGSIRLVYYVRFDC